jgi:hypothetical protein
MFDESDERQQVLWRRNRSGNEVKAREAAVEVMRLKPKFDGIEN